MTGLTALVLVAFAPPAAMAQPYVTNALLSANAGHVNIEGGNDREYAGIGASAGFKLVEPHVNFEAQTSYSQASGAGVTTHQSGLRGVLLWAEPWGRVAATVGRLETDGPGPDAKTTHAHVYGVWFPSDRLTLAAKGGGFSGVDDGEYLAAAANIYLTPNFSLFAAADRTWFDADFREQGYTASIQWLPIARAPVAVGAGLTRTNVSGRFNFDATTAFVGLRFFYNKSGAVTLRDRERTGATGWPSTFGPQSLNLRSRPQGS